MESAKKLHGGLLLTDDKNLLVSHILPALGRNFKKIFAQNRNLRHSHMIAGV